MDNLKKSNFNWKCRIVLFLMGSSLVVEFFWLLASSSRYNASKFGILWISAKFEAPTLLSSFSMTSSSIELICYTLRASIYAYDFAKFQAWKCLIKIFTLKYVAVTGVRKFWIFIHFRLLCLRLQSVDVLGLKIRFFGYFYPLGIYFYSGIKGPLLSNSWILCVDLYEIVGYF